jgi:AcrR family transcriptional regulator
MVARNTNARAASKPAADAISWLRLESGESGLKEAIIKTSLELGSELGEEGLTMRGIASRLGVSATALYQHFESKASILREIRIYGIELLQTALEPALEQQDARGRLREIQRRYIDFARANPWLYSVLMTEQQLEWSELTEEEVARSLKPLLMLREIISEGKASGELRADLDVESAGFQMWAAVHGLCALLIAGRITEDHPAFPVADEKGFIQSFVENLVRSCTT